MCNITFSSTLYAQRFNSVEVSGLFDLKMIFSDDYLLFNI